MIIVDTNVISECLKPAPNLAIVNWLDMQPSESLFLTTVNQAELLAGVAIMPAGIRKNALSHSMQALLRRIFAQRILSFDQAAAVQFAGVTRRTQASGNCVAMADAMIAAIALAGNFAVATRDVAPFIAAGVAVINPWAS
jgi:toxin FitB